MHQLYAAIRQLRRQASRGFTMIEMMIVVAIVGIMTSIVVWNYGDFRSGIIVTNMAYEVATSIREAQLYGLGVRGAAQEGGGYDYGGTYGAIFHTGQTVYQVFRDENQDGLCGDGCACAGGTGECVEQVGMLQNVAVAQVCAASNVDSQATLLASCADKDTLSVSFTRPQPESAIRAGQSGVLANPPPDSGYAAGGIVLRGGTHCRLVTIYQSGQVSVSGLPDNSCGS